MSRAQRVADVRMRKSEQLRTIKAIDGCAQSSEWLRHQRSMSPSCFARNVARVNEFVHLPGKAIWVLCDTRLIDASTR